MFLRKYLRLNGLKVSFFAKQLGINRATLYNYMIGIRATPQAILLSTLYLTKGKVTQVKDKLTTKEILKKSLSTKERSLRAKESILTSKIKTLSP
jgi:transcriptional regulator with XRE-family HTH domain